MNRQVITIFGGSGFVGRHLVRRLAGGGGELRIAVRDIEAAQYLKTLGDVGQVVLLQTDICDAAQVTNAVAGTDTVINLVGVLYERGQRTFEHIHVEGALNVAQAASEAGAKRMVHVSALGADPDSPAQYGRTKAAGEQAVAEAFDGATIFRPSVIFGPEDNFFNLFAGLMRFMPVMPVIGAPALPKISFGGECGVDIDFFDQGGCRFQPVFVGDVAEAMTRALDDKASRGVTYELGGPRAYSFKEIMELLLAATGRKRILVPVPLGVAYAKAVFLQMWPKPLLTPDQANLMRVDNVVSGKAPGLDVLGIGATAAEAIVPTYLHRFRTPSHRDPHAV